MFSSKYPERPCPYFVWKWLPERQDVDIIVFSDSHLAEAENNKSSVKIAWLMEPPVVSKAIYDYVRKNYNLFDYIFTFDESLLPIDKRFLYYPWGTTWIPESSRMIYTKTKGISAIFSNKNWTKGHALRHAVASQFKDFVDLMGKGYRPIESKLEGLSDYRFSFAIENVMLDTQFTEKIMDCFTTGTIPVYWGTKKIVSIFDPYSIIVIDSIEDVRKIIYELDENYYNSRLSGVIENFEIAKKYLYPEKYMWEKCFINL